MSANFSELISHFSKVKVLVVGDVMLDRFWWGSVTRISPEAPVPVVNLQKSTAIVGGAANVAANIKGLGADVFLIGICGQDAEAEELQSILNDLGIFSESIIKSFNRQTTVKTRIVAGSQHIVRIDQEINSALDEADELKMLLEIEKTLPLVDVIIISDYAKGLLTESLLSRLITLAEENSKIILADPKGKDYTRYKGVNLLTPNRNEALVASGLDIEGSYNIRNVGETILGKNLTDALLITEGEEGMTLFVNGKEPLKLSSLARKVFDVTGAGDTVIATLAVSLGAKASLKEAAELANIAAGLVVEKVGTTAIEVEELKSYVHLR